MRRIFYKLNRYFCNNWRLAVLDMDRGRWIVPPEIANIAYLKAENANGRHILIQPDSKGSPFYLLIDDVDWPLIQRHHKYADGRWKPGRMVVETSISNYQVWIHSSRFLSLEEKRYWLRRLRSDPGADPNNRWGRSPGFRNRKDKHREGSGGYPLSKLIWIDWRYRADIPKTHIQEKVVMNHSHQSRKGFVRHRRRICRANYERGDDSATDFAYAMALFRRGKPAEYVRQCILSERKNWSRHSGPKRKENYLKRTIIRARRIINDS